MVNIVHTKALMNLPNKITLARIILIPFILFFILLDEDLIGDGLMAISWTVALVLFIVAAVTDAIDGILARRLNLVTNFGRLMDPLADKLLVASVFVAFVEKEILPAWMVIIILFREFLVTGLRSIASEKGIIIQADRWGKSKTVTQMTTIIASMLLMSVRYFLVWFKQWEPLVKQTGPIDDYIYGLLYVLGVACVILSVGSGSLYLIRNREVLLDN